MRSSSRYDPLHDTAAATAPLVIPADPPSPAAAAAYRSFVATLPADVRDSLVVAQIGTEVGLAEATAALRHALGRREAAGRARRPTTAGERYALAKAATSPPRLMPDNPLNVTELTERRMAAWRAAEIDRRSREGVALLGRSMPTGGLDDREVAGRATTAGAARMAILRGAYIREHAPLPQSR